MQKYLLSLFLIFTVQNIIAESCNVTYQINNTINIYQVSSVDNVDKEKVSGQTVQSYKQLNNQSEAHVKSVIDKKYEKHLDSYNELADQALEKKRLEKESGIFFTGIGFATIIILGLYCKFKD